jgi:Flp pilus assembly protein TadG
MVDLRRPRRIPALVRSRFLACERGAESAESVVALPLIVIVIFTGLEYGWLALRSLQVDAAARAGARQAALAGIGASDVEDAVSNALRRSGINSGTVTITPADPAQAEAGDVVSVEVAVTYSDVGLVGLGGLMPLPESLTGRAAMVREPGP